MRFVENPNLPQNMADKVIIGNYPHIISFLLSLGTESFIIKDNPALQRPVRKHADMSCLHLGSRRLLTYDDNLSEKLTACGFECSRPEREQMPEYPQDIALNCLITGKYYVCNTKYCAAEILAEANKNSGKIISVSQGYARCSTAVIDENSVITSDIGISEKLSSEDFDVLLIRPGYIELPGYNYGFIGGCCGKLEKNLILFSGDLHNHPDGDRMIDFINSKGIEIMTASQNNLLDFGGFIPLEEI